MEPNGTGYNRTIKPSKSFVNIRPKSIPRIEIRREVFTQEDVVTQTEYVPPKMGLAYNCRKCYTSWSLLGMITSLIPIIHWLPKYSPRTDFLPDLIAGATVGVLCIPHGIAYGLLAGVSPNNGLYVGIVPPLVYVILGTSRHASIGTFAVISIMTYKAVQENATEDLQPGEKGFTPLQVVTATAFVTGLVHIVMAIMNLGVLASLMSDPLINGFTVAAAGYVVVAQLKEATGIEIPRYKGLCRNVVSLRRMIEASDKANHVTILMFLIVVTFLIIMADYVKPWSAKYSRIPLPSELLAVIIATLISKWFMLNEHYGVEVVGPIPMGLPDFDVPPVELFPKVLLDAIAIAIVSYTVTMSMGLMIANKLSYEVRPNQELIAIGVGNMVGGLFSCYPLGCSLARSIIQASIGGVTQIATVVSAIIVLMTILWIGAFFKTLPKCVLAAVIMVALKPIFMQVRDVRTYVREGWLEFLVWVVTFWLVVLIDIALGLFVGVCVSLVTLYVNGIRSHYHLLGAVPGGDGLYVDLRQHQNALEITETKIFRFTGALNFATRLEYQKDLYKAVNINYEIMQKAAKSNEPDTMWTTFRVLVLDFSSLAHLDIAGCQQLDQIQKSMNNLGIRMLLASPADNVYDMICRSVNLNCGPFDVFASVHDAVVYGTACRTARFPK